MGVPLWGCLWEFGSRHPVYVMDSLCGQFGGVWGPEHHYGRWGLASRCSGLSIINTITTAGSGCLAVSECDPRTNFQYYHYHCIAV